MKAFLTGSRIYGIPTEESDLDLVIFTDVSDKLDSIYQSVIRCSSEDPEAFALRYGKLNVISLFNDIHYKAWHKAMLMCLLEKPCSRDRAIEIHKATFLEYGFSYNSESGNTNPRK